MLMIKKETEKGRMLLWRGEPFGRIVRHEGGPMWTGEFWSKTEGKCRTWQPEKDPERAALTVLTSWSRTDKIDIDTYRLGML